MLRRGVLIVALAGGALLATVGPSGQVEAAAATRTLTPTDDTQVNSADRVADLGSSSKMTLCTACDAAGSPTKRGFVKFDISTITGTVQSVRLRLSTLAAAPTPIEVQQTTTNWSESSVNWDNAPLKGAVLGASAGGEPAGWIEIPLSTVGSGAYVIETDGSEAIRVATSETATPPQLIVTTETGGGGTRMNVLLIVTDDQRDWPSSKVMMPKTANWLAAAGRTFTEAYVTTPSCCPSRASIMSGRYVHRHGVKRQGEAGDFDQSISIQRLLKEAGYNTAMAGKLLNGWDLAQKPAYFDQAAVANGGYTDEWWGINGVVQQYPDYTTTFIQNKGRDYVDAFEADDATPWFIYLAPFAPHKPHIPEPKYAGAVVPGWSATAAVNENTVDKAPYLSTRSPIAQAELTAFREAQQRTLLSVDDLVDQMMRKLDARGELANTVVIFTSDNGYHWGEQRYLGKFTPYRPSVQVPLLVRWPGRFAADSTSSNLVANIDLAPTIAQIAGITVSSSRFDGRPLTSTTARSRLLLEYWYDAANGVTSAPTWRSTLTPTYQYVETVNTDGSVFHEYYNRAADPWQKDNLYRNATSSDDPPIAPLSSVVNADQRCSGSNCP